MKAFALFPCRVSRSVLARHPRTAGSIEQVLGAEYIGFKEQLGILYAAVNVAFGGKVDNIVNVVIGKKAVSQLAVAYVSMHEHTSLAVYVILYRAVVACIRQRVKHYYINVFILIFPVKEIFYKIGAYESGSSRNKICLHI